MREYAGSMLIVSRRGSHWRRGVELRNLATWKAVGCLTEVGALAEGSGEAFPSEVCCVFGVCVV